MESEGWRQVSNLYHFFPYKAKFTLQLPIQLQQLGFRFGMQSFFHIVL